MMKRVILLLAVWLLLESCDFIMFNLYGIRDLETFDQDAAVSFLSELEPNGFDEVDTVYWDSVRFAGFAGANAEAAVNLTKKDFQQPVQLIYLAGGKVVSFHANCYAPGGWKGLNWNYERRFDSFPPQSAVEIMPGWDFLLNGESGSDQKAETYDLVAVWTLRFEGITRDALNIAVENRKNHAPDIPFRVLLVNVDKCFLNRH